MAKQQGNPFDDINKYLKLKKAADDVKKRPLRYYLYPECFRKATGIPGNPMGGIVQIIGWSDTGKTTDIVTGIVACQKEGHIPVIIDTEKKFSFAYAKRMGFEAEKIEEIDEDTGEVYEKWVGNFIYRDNFESLQELYNFIMTIFEGQEKVVEKYQKDNPKATLKELEDYFDKISVCVFWDSAGTLFSEERLKPGDGTAMMDAKAFGDLFKVRLAAKIRETKKLGCPFWRSFIFVNQIYTGPKANRFDPDRISTKYGEAGKYMADFQRRWGKLANAGTANVSIQYKGHKISIGKVTNIVIEKNHDNGLSLLGVKICTLPHGLVENTKEAIENYKKEHSDYLLEEIKKGISVLGATEEEIETLDIDKVEVEIEGED